MNTQRRKFFTKIGAGALSVGLLSSFPFRIFGKKLSATPAKKSISVSINAEAVQRKNTSTNNASAKG